MVAQEEGEHRVRHASTTSKRVVLRPERSIIRAFAPGAGGFA
jgi:hypothetical protein